MHNIALVTYAKIPELTVDDQLLISEFAHREIKASAAVWNDSTVNWADFDAVLLRSTWDYHLKAEEFRSWLTHLETFGVTVLNPPAMIRWNMDKQYLLELENYGVPIIPTLVVQNGESPNLRQIMEMLHCQKCVVKPAISASAYETWLTDTESAESDQAKFEASLQRNTSLLVQPYVEEIREGEYSVIFFGDSYSHTVRKKPAENSIFVQPEFGGTSENVQMSEEHIEQAYQMLKAGEELSESTSAYVRVDVVMKDEKLVLMELELIEPALYLGASPDAPRRFVESVISHCQR